MSVGGEFRATRKYMLDTDICIYLSESGSPAVARRFAKVKNGEAVVSAVTLAELHYGAIAVSGVARRKIAARGLESLSKVVPAVPFDEDAAAVYAQVRMADPERNIRAMDKLIAAHAIALNLTLVTNNIRDFQKFRPRLRVENWTAKQR